jgi:hypothetical protein
LLKSRLERPVDGRAAYADDVGDRAHVDHGGVRPSGEQGEEDGRNVKRRLEIERHESVHVFFRAFGEALAKARSHVVDQEVDRAPPG